MLSPRKPFQNVDFTEQSNSMDISIVICTYNRAESLRRTLQTCCDLIIPKGVTWELLVVDNNSTDHTKQECAAFVARLPLRYVFEPRQGKSFALNRGIDSSSGEVVLFTDDDVDIDSKWMAEIVSAVQRHPEAAFFGGKVLPCWVIPPPEWIVKSLGQLPPIVHVDRGEHEKVVSKALAEGGSYLFVGANLAFRRRVFDSGLRFCERIGPAGGDDTLGGNLRGEEIDFEERVLESGAVGFYVPSAVVYHRHAPHRLTERYVRKFYVGHGVADMRRVNQLPGGHYWFGAPRFLWRNLIFGTLQYVATRWVCGVQVWLPAEKRMAHTWGMIRECHRLRLNHGECSKG